MEPERTPKVEDQLDSQMLHVLIVDDSLIDRKVMEKLVRKASFKVTSVDCGAGALEVLGVGEDRCAVNSQCVNLIVTDYCMPAMSGYDLLKTVKETPELKDIPVVIVSSENVPSRIQRCLEDGAQRFILKPLKVEDVKLFKTYLRPTKQVAMDDASLLRTSNKKRKYGSEACQAGQCPEAGAQPRPRLSGLAVA